MHLRPQPKGRFPGEISKPQEKIYLGIMLDSSSYAYKHKCKAVVSHGRVLFQSDIIRYGVFVHLCCKKKKRGQFAINIALCTVKHISSETVIFCMMFCEDMVKLHNVYKHYTWCKNNKATDRNSVIKHKDLLTLSFVVLSS